MSEKEPARFDAGTLIIIAFILMAVVSALFSFLGDHSEGGSVKDAGRYADPYTR